jgi:uncharacterized protein YjbI with pentapeptide repeats
LWAQIYPGTDLTHAQFNYGNFTGALFDHAVIDGVSFANATGLTPDQLYSTTTYATGKFSDMDFRSVDLLDMNFGGMDLSRTRFDSARFAAANLSDASIAGANFAGSNLTKEQLYSTQSYKLGDLQGITLTQVAGWSFANQDLRGADLSGYPLTGTDFTGADIRNVNLGYYTQLSVAQLQSTKSYQQRDLSGVRLFLNDLTGNDFSNLNLSNADFSNSTTTNLDFTNSIIKGANFSGTSFSAAQLYSTKSYADRDISGVALPANITRWNFVGQKITGANFSDTGLTADQLHSTASYQLRDLSGVNLSYLDLTTSNFAGFNLRGATLSQSTLTDIDFSASDIEGATFTNITAQQLYSTASYQKKNLRGVNFYESLYNWDLSGQDLTSANFGQAILSGTCLRGAILINANLSPPSFGSAYDVDFSGADMRGSYFYLGNSPITTNTILSDGTITGLDLTNHRTLTIRDDDGGLSPLRTVPRDPISILVKNKMLMDSSGTLRLIFDSDDWGSLIFFDPSISVALGGTLELAFAPDTDVSTQFGRKIQIFDWTGVTPLGQFEIVSPYTWDLSNLYTTGSIMLIPEPSTTIALLIAFCLVPCAAKYAPAARRKG